MTVPSSETIVASQTEKQTKESLEDYEGQMVLYCDATRTQSPVIHVQSSPIIAGPIRLDDLEAGNSGFTAEGGHHRQTATKQKKKRESWHKSKETLVEIGKGTLIIFVTPFAMAGLLLYGCGMILGGLASVFKGIGGLGKLAFVEARNRGLQVEQM